MQFPANFERETAFYSSRIIQNAPEIATSETSSLLTVSSSGESANFRFLRRDTARRLGEIRGCTGATICRKTNVGCAPPAGAWLTADALSIFIRPARVEEAAAPSDLCFRSKAVRGYDAEFMALILAALGIARENRHAAPRVYDAPLTAGAQGSRRIRGRVPYRTKSLGSAAGWRGF